MFQIHTAGGGGGGVKNGIGQFALGSCSNLSTSDMNVDDLRCFSG